jgi:F-type H+-transporting ATPase subunit delta
MTKLKPKIYAQALYLACLESVDVEMTVHNFIKLLAKHSRLSILKSIIKEFLKIYNRENEMIDVLVTSAHALDPVLREKIIDLVKKIKSVKHAEIIENIDPSVISGLKIKFADYQIDATATRKLSLIKNIFNK